MTSHKSWEHHLHSSDSLVINSLHYLTAVTLICVNCQQINGKNVRLAPIQFQMHSNVFQASMTGLYSCWAHEVPSGPPL